MELVKVGMSKLTNGSMRADSIRYFKALGAHIAFLRKSKGMTQGELARQLGVSQQAVFAYETGERRVSLFIVIKLVQVFDISVAELIGMSQPPRTRKQTRFSPRALRHAERLQALGKTQQRFVIQIIDTLESRNSAKA